MPSSPPVERSSATKWTIWISLGAISVVAGVASYLRTLGVIQAADGHAIVAWFEAGLADPTIAAASVNIVDARRHNDETPWLSTLSILVAAVVTVGANIVYGAPHPLPKWLVNVWPPVAFMLALESLMSYLRRGRGGHAVPDPASGSPCPHTLALNVDDAVRAAYGHERDCEGDAPTFVALAARFGLDRKRVAELVKPAAPVPSLNGGGPGGQGAGAP